jgi:hypothetical protein
MAMKVLRLHPGANEPHADALAARMTPRRVLRR